MIISLTHEDERVPVSEKARHTKKVAKSWLSVERKTNANGRIAAMPTIENQRRE